MCRLGLVVRADSRAAICCTTSNLPPFFRYAVIPVARNVKGGWGKPLGREVAPQGAALHTRRRRSRAAPPRNSARLKAGDFASWLLLFCLA